MLLIYYKNDFLFSVYMTQVSCQELMLGIVIVCILIVICIKCRRKPQLPILVRLPETMESGPPESMVENKEASTVISKIKESLEAEKPPVPPDSGVGSVEVEESTGISWLNPTPNVCDNEYYVAGPTESFVEVGADMDAKSSEFSRGQNQRDIDAKRDTFVPRTREAVRFGKDNDWVSL